jgi:hypothetical protein
MKTEKNALFARDSKIPGIRTGILGKVQRDYRHMENPSVPENSNGF